MQVINISHDNLIITEFNGKRFVFRRNIPVGISPEMYQNILLSGHISASEIVPFENKPEEPIGNVTGSIPETISEKITRKVKEKINLKKHKRK